MNKYRTARIQNMNEWLLEHKCPVMVCASEEYEHLTDVQFENYLSFRRNSSLDHDPEVGNQAISDAFRNQRELKAANDL